MRILLILILFTFVPTLTFAGWQDYLEANTTFDHIETFDYYDDFVGDDTIGENTTPAEQPQVGVGHTGSMPPIAQWAHNSVDDPIDFTDWLADHGEANRITGKSIRIDMRDRGDDESPAKVQDGFQHLGWYIGDGSIDSGYDDLYIFYRIKMPRNMLPTYKNPNSTLDSEYVEGDAYEWTWIKHLNAALGFTSISEWNGETTADSARIFDTRYGNGEVLTNFSKPGGNPQYSMTLKQNNLTDKTDLTTGSAYASYDANPYFVNSTYADVWAGVEIRFKRSSDTTTTTLNSRDAVTQMWIYEPDGTKTQIMDQSNMIYRPMSADGGYHGTYDTYPLEPWTHKFNKIVFGGNNSNGFMWGDSMDSQYYIDDVIVNDTAIGDTYFAAVASYNPSNIICYPDVDYDLYPGTGSESVETCSANHYESSHFTAMTEDCDDSNALINPGISPATCVSGVYSDCSGSCSVGVGASFQGVGSVNFTSGPGAVRFQ